MPARRRARVNFPVSARHIFENWFLINESARIVLFDRDNGMGSIPALGFVGMVRVHSSDGRWGGFVCKWQYEKSVPLTPGGRDRS
eukprot:7922373-Pyramimonas_sp.AAC.1